MCPQTPPPQHQLPLSQVRVHDHGRSYTTSSSMRKARVEAPSLDGKLSITNLDSSIIMVKPRRDLYRRLDFAFAHWASMLTWPAAWARALRHSLWRRPVGTLWQVLAWGLDAHLARSRGSSPASYACWWSLGDSQYKCFKVSLSRLLRGYDHLLTIVDYGDDC